MQNGQSSRWNRPLSVAVALFFFLHLIGGVWCVSGGLQASESDRRQLVDVTKPLQERGELTATGFDALSRNGEKRSAIHATVMFSYAAVHFATAVVLGLAYWRIRAVRANS